MENTDTLYQHWYVTIKVLLGVFFVLLGHMMSWFKEGLITGTPIGTSFATFSNMSKTIDVHLVD